YYAVAVLLDLHSFPTRRSSDLHLDRIRALRGFVGTGRLDVLVRGLTTPRLVGAELVDRVLEGLVEVLEVVGPGAVLAGHLVLRRSEEHTSELQSLRHLVCRLLL